MPRILFEYGNERVVKISLGRGNTRSVAALVGLFGSQLAVFQESKYHGMIGVPYWENQLVHEALRRLQSGEEEFDFSDDLLMYQVLPDVYTALRQTLHILFANYGNSFDTQGEKNHLITALEKEQALNGQLLSLRKINFEQLSAEIKKTVTAIIGQIGTQPRNMKKIKALDYSKMISQVLDAKGRVNPSAKMAQSVALRNRLQDRLQEILAIEPRVMERRTRLVAIIQLCELVFKSAQDFLRRLLPNLTKEYFDSHGGRSLQEKVSYRLQALAGDCSQIRIQPFLFPAEQLANEFDHAASMVMRSNYGGAWDELKKSYESLRLRVIRTDLEDYITVITQLMFQPKRKLLTPELESIEKKVLDFRASISGIDDSRFAKRVCREAVSFIEAAFPFMPAKKNATAKQLEPIKKALVQAAQLL